MLLLNEEYFYDKYRHAAYADLLNRSIYSLNRRLADNEEFVWKVCIPKAYSRMETDECPSSEEVEKIPHYEIYVFKQVGTPRNHGNTLVLCKFPDTDRYFGIMLYMKGGSASYIKDEHKYMLRVTDELDRRIVLGFCMMYAGNLENYSYCDSDKPDRWIVYNALTYRCNMMPKRLKSGNASNLANADIKYCDESVVFSGIKFI